MPRRNRVTPFGEIVAVPERGTMMGNRGRLHDEAGLIRRPWQVERWLLCRLEFHGRHRIVMAPNRYTELFFLDEATGLAAGHRPCFECRRESYHAFADAWAAGDASGLGSGRPTARAIDERLQAERVGAGRSKQTFMADVGELADGVLVMLGEDRGRAYLIWEGRLLAWSPGGYSDRLPLPDGEAFFVLTPRSTVAAIRAGYVPEVHPSAKRPGRRDRGRPPADGAGRPSSRASWIDPWCPWSWSGMAAARSCRRARRGWSGRRPDARAQRNQTDLIGCSLTSSRNTSGRE